MKKLMKKIPKMTLAFVMILTIIASYFMPYVTVSADNGYVINFEASDNHEMVNDNGHLRIDGQYVDLRDGNDSTIGTVSCENTKKCKIVVNDDIGGSLNYNSANKFTLFMQGHQFDMNHNFMANENIYVDDYQEFNGMEPGEEHHFDGKAYLVWSCKNGGVCYHYFDNIEVTNDGSSVFYKASTILADNTNEAFDVHAQYKGWYLKDGFNEWLEAYKEVKNIDGDINFADMNPEEIVGEPIDMRKYEEEVINNNICNMDTMSIEDFHGCVDQYVLSKGIIWTNKLQPLPDEPYDNNAYVSYGDRNFKVVIYNDEYKGVSIGDLKDLNYYPASWVNAFIRQDQFDVSGTTKNNPTVIETILLEDTINIKTLEYNGYTITKIEALDVPSNAVNVSKVNGEWKIVFSSNYYDSVVFKATDSNGEVQYFQIRRITIAAELKFVDNKPTISADFYFDKNNSYTDFIISAKIEYRDGTTESIDMQAIYGIDDGLGNITPTYEFNEETDDPGHQAGKGLKRSTFQYMLGDKPGAEENISRVYINVEYKGSTDTVYAGAFAGSNKGIVLELGGDNHEEE